jgi:hypothetical protein
MPVTRPDEEIEAVEGFCEVQALDGAGVGLPASCITEPTHTTLGPFTVGLALTVTCT